MKKAEIIARANVAIAVGRVSLFCSKTIDDDDDVGAVARVLLIADLLERLRDLGEYRLLLAALHAFAPETINTLIDHRETEEATRMLFRVADANGIDGEELLTLPQKRPRVAV